MIRKLLPVNETVTGFCCVFEFYGYKRFLQYVYKMVRQREQLTFLWYFCGNVLVYSN